MYEGMNLMVMWIPGLFFLVWLGVVIYALMLAARFVEAVEKIAGKL